MTKTEEAIAELRTNVSILVSRIDRVDQDIQRLGLEAIRDRLARIETKLDHIEEGRKAVSGRAAIFWAAVISAIFGSVAGAVASYLLQQFPKS